MTYLSFALLRKISKSRTVNECASSNHVLPVMTFRNMDRLLYFILCGEIRYGKSSAMKVEDTCFNVSASFVSLTKVTQKCLILMNSLSIP